MTATVNEILKRLRTDMYQMHPEEEGNAISSLLIRHITGFSKIELLTRQNETLDLKQLQEIERALKLLRRHIPIQYVIGQTEFYDIPIKVSPSVLIPRPETEELVDLAVHLPLPPKPRVLDIGTGSGCIAIAIARNLPGAEIFAMDISFEALEIARHNAEDIGVKIHFSQRDILNQTVQGNKSYDLIISNPPYVTEIERKKMGRNILENEPPVALFVPDHDPLVFYKAIARFALSNLNNKGWLLTEINEQYGKETACIFNGLGFKNSEVVKDINGKDRIVKTQYILNEP